MLCKLSDLPPYSIVLNNNSTANHRQLNRPFLHFLHSHPIFINLYQEPSNRRVRDHKTFRKLILTMLREWLATHPTTKIFHFVWRGKPQHYQLLYDPHQPKLSSKELLQPRSKLMDHFKTACLRIGESRRNFLSKFQSEFVVGGEGWSSSGHFILSNLTVKQKIHLQSYAFNHKFSEHSLPMRCRALLYGASCYTSTLSAAAKQLENASRSNKLQKWRSDPNTPFSKMKDEWQTVKRVHTLFLNRGIVPLRWYWKNVFTSSCTDTNVQGCGHCEGCKILFVQTFLVIVSAQGVSDELILAHWGSIFRHPRFR
jgi:hypothetical protein